MTAPTVHVYSDELRRHLTCTDSPLELSREFLSNNQDPVLHRSRGVAPELVLASGRWRVENPGRKRLVVIAWDKGPLAPEGNDPAHPYPQAEALLDSAEAWVVSDHEPSSRTVVRRLDLVDGSWLLGVLGRRWWFVRLEVTGQPTAASVVTLPVNKTTVDEPLTRVTYSQPLVPGHHQRVQRYLQQKHPTSVGGRVRRAVMLAALYRQYLMDDEGPSEKPVREVTLDLGLTLSALDSVRETIGQQMFGTRSRSRHEVRKYLISEALLTRDDLREADELTAANRANGVRKQTAARALAASREKGRQADAKRDREPEPRQE